MKRVLLLSLFVIGIASSYAQNITIYGSEFNLGKRIRTCYTVEDHINPDHFISTIQSDHFFKDISNKVASKKEVLLSQINSETDSLNKKNKYEDACRLVFVDTIGDTLAFYTGKYFSFNSKFYELDCKVYEYYIGFIPLSYALYATPNSIWTMNCAIAEDMRRYGDIIKFK